MRDTNQIIYGTRGESTAFIWGSWQVLDEVKCRVSFRESAGVIALVIPCILWPPAFDDAFGLIEIKLVFAPLD